PASRPARRESMGADGTTASPSSPTESAASARPPRPKRATDPRRSTRRVTLEQLVVFGASEGVPDECAIPPGRFGRHDQLNYPSHTARDPEMRQRDTEPHDHSLSRDQ